MERTTVMMISVSNHQTAAIKPRASEAIVVFFPSVAQGTDFK